MLTQDDLQAIRILIKEENKPIKRDIKKIQKTLDATISVFDRDINNLNKDVAVIKDHLQLPTTN